MRVYFRSSLKMQTEILNKVLCLAYLLKALSICGVDIVRSDKYEEDWTTDFWRRSAVMKLTDKLKTQPLEKEARNVVFFLGDGWDIQTLTAARILKGQKVNQLKFGEEAKLHIESFPYTGLSKTYCADLQVGESACTATAYLAGVKANAETIGVTSAVKAKNCTASKLLTNQVSSILSWAQSAGKCTGIVTTTSVTHASPAGTYAHTAYRNWESYADMMSSGQDPSTCDDIAEQLILRNPGMNIDVILGGGRQKFIPEYEKDSEGFHGERKDGKNLINVWKTLKNRKHAVYVETVEELNNVNVNNTDALLGLFSPKHMPFYHDLEKNGDPRLKLMTQKAIEICSRNPNGYFIMVEGGLIDHGHHFNLAQRALWESIEFDEAIKTADLMTNDKDTLIVVTADHGHVMTFSGYPARGSDIMGVASQAASDGLPYATLGYANGPGFVQFVNNSRYNISKDNLASLNNMRKPMVPLPIETHGGQDVQILAKGPFAHLFSGIVEQNYIPIAMAYASCIGNGPTYCNVDKSQE